MKDLGKYGNKSYINQFIDYFGGVNFNIIGSFNQSLAYGKLTEGLSKALLPTEMAEHQLSYTLFISMGMNTKVNRTINGKTERISLFDAFELKNNNLSLKEGVELTKEQKEDFMARLNNSARRINGEYGKMDIVTAQKDIGGRMFLFMNKYWVPFFMNRFRSRRFNINEGLEDDGFWALTFKTIYKDLKNFNFNVVRNWSYYTDSQKVAMKKAGTEIAVSVAIIGMISALGGDDDKELKDNGIVANNIIYLLKGIKRQNEQFMLVPGLGLDDVIQRVKNPFPIMTKITQAAALLNDAAYLAGYPMGITEKKDIMYTQKQGWHNKGDLKILSDVKRLMGGPNKLDQLLHPDQAIKNLQAYHMK